MDPAGTRFAASAPAHAVDLFSADRPIASKDEDLLGRTSFAQSLAHAIEGWRSEDSLIIGLYGLWGSGKTSLKNLVVEELCGRIGIVEFDPWQWSAQGEIAEAFFEQLARGIAGRPGIGWWGRRKAQWRAFQIRHYARLLDVAASGLGLAGRMGRFLAALCTPDLRRGPVRAKVKLGGLLRRLDRPVLVVIDDIDRLTRAEIRLVFQLVKSNADFPNLVYLLLFDRRVVEAALDEDGLPGRDYLEKVVQVGFDLPHVERSRLDRVLFAALDEVFLLPGASDRWDAQRW
ncbi:MAG TPA: P-loop NTPase fold protein, partial [Actinomycetota bacterium]|nr:P-loop NTPase fold protein [Actinomycetota bacterium]